MSGMVSSLSASDPTQSALEGGRTPLASWYALGVLVLTTVFAFVDRQILNLVMPSLQKSLDLSDLQLGALQGLGLAIFASVASYPMGWLADRFGRRLLLIVGVVIWSLSTAACAFQTSFVGLFTATIGIAVGEAGLMPIIFAMIPDLFRERQRNTANFVYFASTILGGAVGVALGGAALAWIGSHQFLLPPAIVGMETWRVAVLIVALPAPLFVLMVSTLPTGKLPYRSSPEASAQEADQRNFLSFVRANRRTFSYVFGGILGYCLPLSAAYGWLPNAVYRAFGLPPAEAGFQMGTAMGVASVVGVSLPGLARRYAGGDPAVRSLRIARVLVLIAAAPTILLAFAPSAQMVFIFAAAQLVFCIGTAALMPGIVQDLSPPSLRSRILSIVGIVLAMGHAVSPLLVGALSGGLGGSRSVLNALSIVGVVGLAVAALCFSLALEPMKRTVAAIRA